MGNKQIEKVAKESDYFSFSDEQWNDLKRILKKYETGNGKKFSSNVNQFILELECICSLSKKMMTWDNYLKNRRNLEALRKHLQKALKILNPSAIDDHGKLKAAESGPFTLSAYPQTYYDETKITTLAEILPKEQSFWKRANNAILAIMNLLALLNDSKRFMDAKKKKRGQQPADQDKLVSSIGEAFQRHLGERPTSYQEGPFVEVVRIALKAIGRDSEYPDRQIRAAIKQLRG
jgi:hypothetical protein